MSVNKLTQARAAVGSLLVGSTSGKKNPAGSSPVEVSGIHTTSSTVNPGAIAANTSYSTTVTYAGVAAGDAVVVIPPAGTNAAISFDAWVSAANTITLCLHNVSAGSVTPASATWTLLIFKLAPNN